MAERSALITGSGGGVGLEIAHALAKEGCALHLAGGSEDELETTAEILRATYAVEVDIHPEDLTEIVNLEALALECDEVQILVHAAGAFPAGTISEVDAGRWKRAWEIRVESTVNLTREIYESMCDRSDGVIIIVLDPSGRTPDPNRICVTTCNAALVAFTQTLGRAGTEQGIKVVGVDPGTTCSQEKIAAAVARLAVGEDSHPGGSILSPSTVLESGD